MNETQIEIRYFTSVSYAKKLNQTVGNYLIMKTCNKLVEMAGMIAKIERE